MNKKSFVKAYAKNDVNAFYRRPVGLHFDENNQFDTLFIDEQKEILIKILDKNHLYVNYSEMDDTQFEISDEVKKFNREFYEVK